MQDTAQIVNDTLNQGVNAMNGVPVESETKLIDIIFSGGIIGQTLMVVIFIMLFVAIYLYIERWLVIKKTTKSDHDFIHQVKILLSQGKIEEAKMFCKSSNTPAARMIEKGISRIGKPIEDINMAMENQGSQEVYKMEKNLNILATLSGAGPMTGFLGTVVGMVMAFHEMAEQGGAKINMGVLAEGVYTAMMTTVFGLIVGIIAYVGYNVLLGRISRFSQRLENDAAMFFDLLNEPA